MKPLEVAFLRRLVEKKPSDLKMGGLAAQMAQLQGLGSVRGARVLYTNQDYDSAESMLKNRAIEITAPLEQFTRSQAPSGSSEKVDALPVMHALVAVKPIGFRGELEGVSDQLQGGFMVIPWTQALAMPYEALLVCENLEPLMLLHEYAWLEGLIRGRPVLSMFRGASNVFRTDAAAKLIAADHRPTLAFFDFDPKGLSMAASLPRREVLCLPPWDVLESKIREQQRENLFVQSVHTCRTHLDQAADPEIALSWRRMKRLSKGLDQEHFPR